MLETLGWHPQHQKLKVARNGDARPQSQHSVCSQEHCEVKVSLVCIVCFQPQDLAAPCKDGQVGRALGGQCSFPPVSTPWRERVVVLQLRMEAEPNLRRFPRQLQAWNSSVCRVLSVILCSFLYKSFKGFSKHFYEAVGLRKLNVKPVQSFL